jgi:hypothetical protein
VAYARHAAAALRVAAIGVLYAGLFVATMIALTAAGVWWA